MCYTLSSIDASRRRRARWGANMVEAHVLGAEVVLARAYDDGREGEGAAHPRLIDGVRALHWACSVLNVYQLSGIFGPPTRARD